MLSGSYGASTCGNILRPIENILLSSRSSTITTAGVMQQRTLANVTRSTTVMVQQRVWHQLHGIFFSAKSALYESRQFASSTAVEINKNRSLRERQRDINTDSDTTSAQDFAPALEAGVMGLAAVTQNHLPVSDSVFLMKEELFRKARNAEPGTPASFWSHRLYRGPEVDGILTRPTVHYCRSIQTTEQVLQTYFMGQKVLGFDIEWKPDALKHHGPRANVSLIQLASEERIALFHVALYPKSDALVAPSLRKIMNDPTVSKVGVSIKSDCTRMKKHLHIESQGLFELSHLFRLVKYAPNKEYGLINKKLVSLATQVQEHLHLPLFKGGDVRWSDWSQKLHLHQIIYAAADSYAAVQLYNTMECKRRTLNPTPPRPHHAELNIPIMFPEDIMTPELKTGEVEAEAEAESDADTPLPTLPEDSSTCSTPMRDADVNVIVISTERLASDSGSEQTRHPLLPTIASASTSAMHSYDKTASPVVALVRSNPAE